MLFWRRIEALDFRRMLAVHRIPDGPVEVVAAAGPMRSRRDGDMVVLRFDSGQYAVAVSPRGLAWHWPEESGEPRRMMLYSATGTRAARGELRRVSRPQRRDALYKADLLSAGADNRIARD